MAIREPLRHHHVIRGHFPMFGPERLCEAKVATNDLCLSQSLKQSHLHYLMDSSD